MDEPERISLTTESEQERRLAALEEILPGAFVDGALDLGLVADILDLSADGDAERYGLSWVGKAEAKEALAIGSTGTLAPDADRSVEYDRARHALVVGDNLEVLRLLQRGYNDEFALVYIDPPYNTGEDLIYNDDFRDGLNNYLRRSGQIDGGGYLLRSNTDRNGRVHSDWLTMMYPRLSLARNLLAQDGLILVSINDIEVANLRLLLDEVFGPTNFLATFVWNNEGNIEQQSAIKTNHEYVVAYARNRSRLRTPRVIDPNIDDDSKLFNDAISNSVVKNGKANPPSTITLPVGFPARDEQFTVEPRDDAWPHILDPIVVEDHKLVAPVRVYSGWASKNLVELFINNGYVPIPDANGKDTRFYLTPSGAIYSHKTRPEDQHHVLTVLRNMGTTREQSAALSKELGIEFSFPKPEYLIEYLVSAFTRDDDRVLDFFAGSGTTGAAVLRANAKDGGRRRFTLVQLDEPIDDEALLERGYRTLADETYARVEASITKHAPTDGLRVLALAASNFKIWEPTSASTNAEALADLLADFADSLKSEANPHAIALEVAIKQGLTMDLPCEAMQVCEQPVYVWGEKELAVCLAAEATDDLVFGLIDLGASRVVMLEAAFSDGRDDQKSNAYFRFQEADITMRTV